ncbi:MAG: NUDIX domain-containing protein [Candidatus Woesearchaeota archaeon]
MKIVVVKKEVLLKNYFNGFKDANSFDYQSIILKNYEFLDRNIAEVNPNYKQPIPYGIIINPENKILLYKRGNKNYNEKRLAEKYSIGIGGHIDQEDLENNNENFLEFALMREIQEEIKLEKESIQKVELIGYINDDSNDVGKVHFGLVYLIKINFSTIIPNDDEIIFFDFKDVKDLEQYKDKFETWSLICYEYLKGRAK